MKSPRSVEADEPPSRGRRTPQQSTPGIVSFSSTTPNVVSVPSPLAHVAVPLPIPESLPTPPPVRPAKAAPTGHRFPISDRSRGFKRLFFPEASNAEWNDWRWQSRNRLRTVEHLERVFQLSDDERGALKQHFGSLPVGITPYYASLIDRTDAFQPLRRTVLPVGAEFTQSPGESDDPLGEDHDSPVPGLVHRYPDRVLFLVNKFCSVYCRYCTRARLVGESEGEYRFDSNQWERALAYIEATPAIRDVLISGGDPLTLADEKLDYLLGRLKQINHVEFVRIGTKVPAVLPQRITPQLIKIFRKHRPLWMSIHFLHPEELTPEVAEATSRLADAGIPLGSQTVLLKGINDTVDVMKQLVHGLLKNRVRPYYLYQCDPITGSAHFRTPVETGIDIIRGLRGHTSGYAVPQYVIDAPNGGGKIPLLPNYVVGRDGDDLILTNFEGGTYRYPDPTGRTGLDVR